MGKLKKCNLVYVLLLIGIISCQNDSQKKISSESEEMPLIEFSLEEDSIISKSEIELRVAEILKSHTGSKIEVLKKGNDIGSLVFQDSTAVCSAISMKNRFELLDRIIRDVNAPEYTFICYYDDEHSPYIAVMKESNELKFIEKRGTQAINYNMISKDLVFNLKHWKKKYDFKVIGVGSDFIDIKFDTAPKQTKEFEEMVGDFCPDALDWLNDKEYILLMDEGSDYLNLWWD